jgi:hypothetical protein
LDLRHFKERISDRQKYGSKRGEGLQMLDFAILRGMEEHGGAPVSGALQSLGSFCRFCVFG